MSGRLLVATQVVDPDHPFLGATVGKLRALACRLDELVVLADSAVAGVLPENCTVHVFGSGSREQRARRFLLALQRELSPRPLAVLAHIVPLYALLAAPLVRPRRVPLLLWFTHWKPSLKLALAERVSTAVLSVDRRSFPLPSRKLVPIGHGIDTDVFVCTPRSDAGRLRVVSLGRTSPAKGFETIARAAALAEVELEIYGASSTAEERAERARLLELGARVCNPLPYTRVPELLAARDVLVNNMREGALDKVVFEAAATCMPVLASNSGFDSLLPAELRFARDDAAELAEKLRALAGVDRNALGRTLRQRVEEAHSATHWAERVLEVARA
jgi:glycosyltransferase involved in cell wall biosynthesis